MTINFDAIPPELVELPRWVLWRGQKIPFCPATPRKTASSTDPATWSDFETVRAAYSPTRDGGIGFVLTGQDGLACIDIDHSNAHEAVELLRKLNCHYIERSPSGNGLHGWGLFSGALPRKKGRYQNLDVEIYCDQRYMTVTGDVIEHGSLAPLSGAIELSEQLQRRTEDLQKRTEENRSTQRMTDVIFSPLQCSSVGEFMPSTEGERNRRLFEFARYLKGKAPNAEKVELRPMVEEWHRLALPVIGTKDFSITWADFLRGWEKVKHPHGALLADLLEGVEDDPVPTGLEELGYGHQTLLLAKICKRLARHHDSDPFFISARQAAKLIDVHFTDAAKILNALVFDDVLELVHKGIGKVASRYRWIWRA